jgi:hypothetical protein
METALLLICQWWAWAAARRLRCKVTAAQQRQPAAVLSEEKRRWSSLPSPISHSHHRRRNSVTGGAIAHFACRQSDKLICAAQTQPTNCLLHPREVPAAKQLSLLSIILPLKFLFSIIFQNH